MPAASGPVYVRRVPIVLREMTREAAEAVDVGERPDDLWFAEDYPTEFSTGVAQQVGGEGQIGPFFLQRAEDGVVIGEIGARSSTRTGRSRSGTRSSSPTGTAATRLRRSKRS